jgi:hypothetical protein
MYLGYAKIMTAGQVQDLERFTVQELPGNHAYQATASRRPLFARVPARGRVNELLATEVLNALPWSGAVRDTAELQPDGGWKLINFDGAAGVRLQYNLNGTPYNGINTYTGQVQVRGEGTDIGKTFQLLVIRGGGTSVSATNDVVLTSEWQTVPVTFTTLADTVGVQLRFNYISGGPTAPIVRFPQFEFGPTATPYQRVGIGAFDVTEEAEPTLHGWLFDGVDDSLETNVIDNTTSSSQVTVVVGTRALSNAVARFAVEYGPNVTTTAGSFGLITPSSSGIDNIGWRVRGSASVGSANATLVAPYSAVISGISNEDTNKHRMRVDGVLVNETANNNLDIPLTNQKLFIGCRNGASNFRDGYTFGLVFRAKADDIPLLQKIEKFIGRRTGKNL